MSKRRPAVGTRVMWIHGRKDYAAYGEIGTVTEHVGGRGFKVVTDDRQPFHRAMLGAKSKATGHARTITLITEHVEPLAKVYRENARRLRRVAQDWDAAARVIEEERRTK